MLLRRSDLVAGMIICSGFGIWIGRETLQDLNGLRLPWGVWVFIVFGLLGIVRVCWHHWSHWDFIIWEWQWNAPKLWNPPQTNLGWLKYIWFGPVLGAGCSPWLKLAPTIMRVALMSTLGCWLITIFLYGSLAYLRGLLNVHKR